ncbi:MAG: hypothetical protein RMK29_16640, partial [Myxococcales bacterium]|nr:hypothetical protein [Myxococcales bacterium]
MNRFLLALRCFLAVLLYYRLPKDALALVPPPAPAPPQLEEGAPVEAGAEAAVEAGAEAAVEAGAEAAV